jgi:hypothetical protein
LGAGPFMLATPVLLAGYAVVRANATKVLFLRVAGLQGLLILGETGNHRLWEAPLERTCSSRIGNITNTIYKQQGACWAA